MTEIENSLDASLPLDLLDRQEFVTRILTIAKVLSDNKKNACYAINGNWGVGKSFVLDIFEEQAAKEHVEGEELSRFLIFRYNCWEYDYYEEPLIAIVASMIDQIEAKQDLIPREIKEKIVAILKIIGKGLFKKAIQAFEEKTKIDASKIVDIFKESGEMAEAEIEQSHEYDEYYNFKKTLEELRKTIMALSKDQTIVFIVDELDRCLPEYTIKVLERLHHLFENIPNTQTILSIDIGQLEHIVHQIYGEGTDTKKYLRKFIQFELKLDEGSLERNNFTERFQKYLQHFELQYNSSSENDFNEFAISILDGLDMRNRISIIDRCNLIHNILCDDSKYNSSYMCIELLLVILNDYGINVEYSKKHFTITSIFEPSHLGRDDNKQIPLGLKSLSDKYKESQKDNYSGEWYYRRGSAYYGGNQNYVAINIETALGVILGAYRFVLGFDDDSYSNTNTDNKQRQKELNIYSAKFWEALGTIS